MWFFIWIQHENPYWCAAVASRHRTFLTQKCFHTEKCRLTISRPPVWISCFLSGSDNLDNILFRSNSPDWCMLPVVHWHLTLLQEIAGGVLFPASVFACSWASLLKAHDLVNTGHKAKNKSSTEAATFSVTVTRSYRSQCCCALRNSLKSITTHNAIVELLCIGFCHTYMWNLCRRLLWLNLQCISSLRQKTENMAEMLPA